MTSPEFPQESDAVGRYLVPLESTASFADAFAGARLALSGMWFLLKHPSLWRYTIFSMLLTIFLFLSLASVGIGVVTTWLPSVWARPDGFMGVLWFTTLSLLIVVILLVILGFTTLLNGMVAGFYLDQLAERVETIVCGPSERESLPGSMIGDILGGIKSSGLKLVFWMGGMTLLGALNVVPGLGTLVAAAGGLAWTSLLLALEFTDPPLSRRGYSLADKWSFAQREWRLLVGFGAGAGALLSIPLVNLFVAPVALVGGTLCFLALEEAGRLKTPDRRPLRAGSPACAGVPPSENATNGTEPLHHGEDSVA